ncbi:HIT family protein [Rubrivirga sp.]|uniref:HIT family protein n=1 Tax=Rubrivirga sp. TaxID=1885344 RepID=UPI003B51D949
MSDRHPDPYSPDGCVFCEIIAGDSPASVFYEDDLVLGLMTTGPVTTGHAMVIPKAHAPYLAQLDEEAGRQMWTVAQRAAAALRSASEESDEIECEAVSLYLADGRAASQEIFHVHLHVFPRYEGDPFSLVADWSIHPPREELDQIASQIKASYKELGQGSGAV